MTNIKLFAGCRLGNHDKCSGTYTAIDGKRICGCRCHGEQPEGDAT